MKFPILKKASKEYLHLSWRFLLFDLMFILSVSIFFFYARARILGYMASIEQYSSAISLVQNTVQGQGDTSQLTNLLSGLGPLANKAYFFMFFVIPAFVILAWIIFEGPNYSMLKKGKPFDLRTIGRFAAVSIPGLIFIALILTHLVSLFVEWSYSLQSGWSILVFSTLLVFVLYILHIAFSILGRVSLPRIIDRSVALGIRHFYVAFPLVLLSLLIGSLAFLGWLFSWARIVSGNYGILLPGAFMVFMLAICGWMRIYFAFFIQSRHSGTK